MKVSAAQNIALIGFMATGKSTIGRALANSTGRQFFDTDTLVEKITGKPITRIFDEEGEEAFRRLEAEVVCNVCKNESSVISFGGGVVLSSLNVEMMRKTSVVVLLRATVETILERSGSISVRPLLNVKEDEVKKRITELLEDRCAAYETAMDVVIDTDDQNAKEVVNEIMRRLGL
ncbi:MAG: shikimate kinase [Candidatus Thorarchaeota archaeon]|jgi:shikimate kinase